MATIRDAMRVNRHSTAGNAAEQTNAAHECMVCGNIDLRVTEVRPLCPPCHKANTQGD